MFTKSLDLTLKHDGVSGLMFYLVHLVLLTGLSTMLVFFLGHMGLIEGTVGTFFEGGDIHTLIGTLFVLWLGGSILHAKSLTNDIMSVIIVGVGIYLAWTTGAILGLIPIALLTTLGKK